MKRNMTLRISLIAAAFAVAMPALATQPAPCKKDCTPTTPTPTVPTYNNHNTNQSTNANANTNVNSLAQGQMQGQAQIQGITNSGNSSSTALGGSANSTSTANGGSSTAYGYGGAGGQGGTGGQGGSAYGGNSQSSSTGGSSNVSNAGNSTVTSNTGGNSLTNEGNNAKQNTTVNVAGDHYEAPRIPVATAYAAPLTAANGTCMGSSSAGGQGVGFGLSFGTTWTDSDCDRRYDAQELRAQGLTKAATALLCQKATIREAMKAAGTPCPQDSQRAEAQPAIQSAQVATEAESSVQYTGDDPIIRQRLGLPPLAKMTR